MENSRVRPFLLTTLFYSLACPSIAASQQQIVASVAPLLEDAITVHAEFGTTLAQRSPSGFFVNDERPSEKSISWRNADQLSALNPAVITWRIVDENGTTRSDTANTTLTFDLDESYQTESFAKRHQQFHDTNHPSGKSIRNSPAPPSYSVQCVPGDPVVGSCGVGKCNATVVNTSGNILNVEWANTSESSSTSLSYSQTYIRCGDEFDRVRCTAEDSVVAHKSGSADLQNGMIKSTANQNTISVQFLSDSTLEDIPLASVYILCGTEKATTSSYFQNKLLNNGFRSRVEIVQGIGYTQLWAQSGGKAVITPRASTQGHTLPLPFDIDFQKIKHDNPIDGRVFIVWDCSIVGISLSSWLSSLAIRDAFLTKVQSEIAAVGKTDVSIISAEADGQQSIIVAFRINMDEDTSTTTTLVSDSKKKGDDWLKKNEQTTLLGTDVTISVVNKNGYFDSGKIIECRKDCIEIDMPTSSCATACVNGSDTATQKLQTVAFSPFVSSCDSTNYAIRDVACNGNCNQHVQETSAPTKTPTRPPTVESDESKADVGKFNDWWIGVICFLIGFLGLLFIFYTLEKRASKNDEIHEEHHMPGFSSLYHAAQRLGHSKHSALDGVHHALGHKFKRDKAGHPLLEMKDIQLLKVYRERTYHRLYRAYHRILKDDVAVVQTKASDSKVFQDLEQNSQIEVLSVLGHFNHKNVLAIVGVVRRAVNVPPATVVEWAARGRLDEYLVQNNNKSTRLRPVAKLRMAIDVSRALGYLKTKHFYSNDVAARNCLLCQDFSVKLYNLDTAKSLKPGAMYFLSKSGKTLYRWLPREMAASHAKSTERGTVWQFGLFLYELWTNGRIPYGQNCWDSEDTMLGMLEALRNGDFLPMPDECQEEFYEIACESWDPNPHLRPNLSSILKRLVNMKKENPDFADNRVAIAKSFKGMANKVISLKMATAFQKSAPSQPSIWAEAPMEQKDIRKARSEVMSKAFLPSTGLSPKDGGYLSASTTASPNYLEVNQGGSPLR